MLFSWFALAVSDHDMVETRRPRWSGFSRKSRRSPVARPLTARHDRTRRTDQGWKMSCMAPNRLCHEPARTELMSFDIVERTPLRGPTSPHPKATVRGARPARSIWTRRSQLSRADWAENALSRVKDRIEDGIAARMPLNFLAGAVKRSAPDRAPLAVPLNRDVGLDIQQVAWCSWKPIDRNVSQYRPRRGTQCRRER